MEPHAEVSEYSNGLGLRSSLFASSLGNLSWPSPSGANGPIGLSWEADATGFNAKRIAYGLACHTAAACPQSSSGETRVRGRSFEFGLNDLSAPEVGEPAGDLLQGGWLRDTKGLAISAEDQGGGLAELTAAFDDGSVLVSPSNCAMSAGYYIELRPCPLARATEWEVDTADFPDGVHSVAVSATDAGNMKVDKMLAFKVDNSAPAIPDATWTEDGELWRRVNGFAVRWSEGDEFAPIVRVHYEICPQDRPDACLIASSMINHEAALHLDVSQPGAYQVRLWHEDAAGNVNSDAKSPPVLLRFDDEVPGDPYLDSGPDWLSADQAIQYKQHVHLADEGIVPVSGIVGYSITVDGSEPNESVDVVGLASDYSLGNLPEGETVVKAQTLSGAGVPSAAVASTVVKVDKTPPIVSIQGGPVVDGWQTQPVVFDIRGTDQPLLSGMVAASPAFPATDGAHVASQLDDEDMSTERGAYSRVTVGDDGHHELVYHAVDLAGNPSEKKSVAFKIDRTPPTGVFRPMDAGDPQRLVVGVSDATSGVEGGWIEHRRDGAEGFTRLPTRLEGDRMSARVDDSALAPGRYEFRAVVRDVAGNEAVVGRRADGSAMELGLPVRELTRLQVDADGKPKPCANAKRQRMAKRKRLKSKRKAHAKCRKPKRRAGGATLELAPAKRVKLVGRLTKGDDVPVAGAEVTIEGQLRSGGPFARVGTARADGQGRLRFVLPPGPSRTVRFRYGGNDTVHPSSAQVLTRVRAAVRLIVDRRRLVNGQSVRFKGRLPGKPIPAGGKLVALQARVGRQWRTFATPRANANGVFKHRYRFTATTGLRRYVFRALVAREAAYPYETGVSRRVYVTVRGR